MKNIKFASKKISLTLLAAVFLFSFNIWTPMVRADTADIGTYDNPSSADTGTYPSTTDIGTYSYPSAADIGTYSYPSSADVGTYDYPTTADIGTYNNPSSADIGTYNYPASADIGTYSYPSTVYIGTYNYPITNNVSGYGYVPYYGAPSDSYSDANPAHYNFPSPVIPATNPAASTDIGHYNFSFTPASYGYAYQAPDIGKYNFTVPQTPVAYAATAAPNPANYPNFTVPYQTAYAASYYAPNYETASVPVAQAATEAPAKSISTPVANAATGPEDLWLWVFPGGLILAAAIYLLLFKARFGHGIALADAYNGAILERKIGKIKKSEAKADTETNENQS